MIKHKRMFILSTAFVLFLLCPNSSNCCTSSDPKKTAGTNAPTDTGNANPSETTDTNTETVPGN